jgi:hypothetical protein
MDYNGAHPQHEGSMYFNVDLYWWDRFSQKLLIYSKLAYAIKSHHKLQLFKNVFRYIEYLIKKLITGTAV